MVAEDDLDLAAIAGRLRNLLGIQRAYLSAFLQR